MNCVDFETIVIEIGRDSLMDALMRERGLEHTRHCSSCASLLAEEQALSRGLRALSVEDAAEEIPERIEIALRDAFRKPAAAPISSHIGPARNHRRFLAIAALALLTIGVSMAFWIASAKRRESPARDFTVIIATNPAHKPHPDKPKPQSPSTFDEQKPVESISGSMHWKHHKRLAKARDNGQYSNEMVQRESVTQFFPVMPGGDLIPIESGRIIRVRMPRSNLIPLGIPFNQERLNEIINADVLISNDGLARAIRLVYNP